MPVYKNFIDGEWVPAASGATHENRNPALHEQVLGLFPQSGPEDVARAVDAAARALKSWSLVPAPKRAMKSLSCSVCNIEPVGILKACTTHVRTNSAKITAMTIDSKYSRSVDFSKLAMRVSFSWCAVKSHPHRLYALRASRDASPRRLPPLPWTSQPRCARQPTNPHSWPTFSTARNAS